jgi:hypothetical protein
LWLCSRSTMAHRLVCAREPRTPQYPNGPLPYWHAGRSQPAPRLAPQARRGFPSRPARGGSSTAKTFWRSCGRSTRRSTSNAWSSLHWFNRPSLASPRARRRGHSDSGGGRSAFGRCPSRPARRAAVPRVEPQQDIGETENGPGRLVALAPDAFRQRVIRRDVQTSPRRSPAAGLRC